MRAEGDTDQNTTNSHIIAARIIKRGGVITHHDINAVLAENGHSITEAELVELTNLTYDTYSMKSLKDAIATIKKLYPKMPKGQGQ